jgi:hypothetical protein
MSETVFSNIFICPKCKYANPENAKFCMQCGHPAAETTQSKSNGIQVTDKAGNIVINQEIADKITIGGMNGVPLTGYTGSDPIVEIKKIGNKFLIKPKSEFKVFIQSMDAKEHEILPGQDFIINGNVFHLK